MLRCTGVKLELAVDADMYLIVEKGTGGGISMANLYATAYNPGEPSTYIIYLDANNLYGWPTPQCLLMGGFSWVPEDQLESLDVMTYSQPWGHRIQPGG